MTLLILKKVFNDEFRNHTIADDDLKLDGSMPR